MNCLLIDDEQLSLDLLEAYIQKLPQLTLIQKCDNPIKAMQILQKHSIDLIFLDIQMPELTGIELLRALKTKAQVILVTAYQEYAIEGFELDVTDYLLKPISFERFVKAVNKASEFHQLSKPQSSVIAPSSIAELPSNDHFFIKENYKLIKITCADILYIEGMQEYVRIHTLHARHTIHKSMKSMEAELPEAQFQRCHKSYIVALDKIQAISGNVIELPDIKIPIGTRYKENFLKKIARL